MMFIEATDEIGFPAMINLDHVRKFTRSEYGDTVLCTVTYESGGQEDIYDLPYESLVELFAHMRRLCFRKTGLTETPNPEGGAE